MLRAVFFDMDGVIFDSMPHHAEAWEEVMERYQLDFTARDCYLNEGRTGQDVITECYTRKYGKQPADSLIKQIYDEKTEAFTRRGEAKTIEGIADVLHFLQEKGIDIWIVTGSGQKTLFDNLEQHFPTVFQREKMITAFDVVLGKPRPEPYLKAWERSGYKKEECIIVENAPLGVISGKAAGLYTIAVNTGVLTVNDLQQAGADLVLDDMKQLLSWLQQEVQA